MYHPSRGGVRGGRDQFSWDDVKVDKHRENYLGHSIKAPVGRWQKGKDLHWYNRDKKSDDLNSKAMKEEIQRIKEEEEQAMREALGLAPKSSKRPQGSRLDKHEFAELIKRGSTAEDLGAGHAEAAEVRGLGLSRGPHHPEELGLSSSILVPASVEMTIPAPTAVPRDDVKETEDERERKRRKHEEKRREKHEEKRREKQEKRDKRHSRESDEKRKHKKHKEKRRHDSD